MQEEMVFTRSASGLVRQLTWWDVFVMVIAAPTASGILYFSVSTASAYPGANLPVAFLIGMLMFLPVCGLVAILSSIISRSGSLYIGVSRLIDPTIGFIGSILFFLGYSLTMGVLGHIISGIIGGIMLSTKTIGDIAFIKLIGSALQTPLWGTVFGFIWVAIFWLITIKGIKPYKYVLWTLFILPLISTLIAIVCFLAASTTGAEVAFNSSWGSGAFQKIMELAKNNGWGPPSFSWGSTFGVLLVVIWTYGGIEMVSYASGEVRTARKSMIRGFLLGWLALGILYIVLAFSVRHSYGEFIGSYDFLYKNHLEQLNGVMPAIKPSIPFYISSLISNSWIGLIIGLTISLWFVNTMLSFFLGISRLIFGLAMDRAIPKKMADVNKNGAPTWATHLVALFGIIGVLFSALNVKIILGTLTFAAFFLLWLYGLAGMLLPYRRADIYERSPIKQKVLGVPLITILGFLTFAVGWFIIFITAKEISISVAIMLILFMVLGLVLYFVQQNKNMKKGIDLIKVYSQIPPE